jgi:hypothetical protein
MSEKSSDHAGGLLMLGVMLAVGLIVSTVIATRTVERIKTSYQTITVKGYAERAITSDYAVWKGNFMARSNELVDGYNKLERNLGIVLDYLEQNGVRKDDIDVSSVSTSINYVRNEKGEETNEIEGYVLYQSVSISTSDVALIDRMSRESTSLIKQGIEFRSYSPEYLYTKLEELKIEMLGEATANAKQRAGELATNSGSTVGVMRSARQGVFQITPAYSTEVENYGMYDTSTIEKKIKAVVTIDYSIR